MRNKLNTTILCILLTAVNVLAKEGPPNPEPVALTIVWDASSSVRSSWSELGSLSRQAISSLRPNDYLEVISAHSSRPRLRAAQFIQSGNVEETKTISSLLRNITCPLLVDAHVAKAVELAFKRLDHFWSKKPDRKVIVIVLTDGRLKDSEAKKICQIAAELRKRNWQLYLTGTYQTNKKLLVSASQGLFNWSLISQANPSLWFETLRTDSSTNTWKPPTQQLSQKTPQDKKTIELITAQAPNDTETSNVVESQKSKSPEEPKYKIETSFDSAVSILHQGEKIDSTPKAPLQDLAEEPNEALPDLAKKADTDQIEELPESSASIETDPESERTRGKIFWWILLPAVALLALIAFILSKSLKNAKKWEEQADSHLKTTQHQNSGILIAKLNGQSYRLGPLDRFRTANIGSGTKNTIRIQDKSIFDRHIKIYRKANDLMLKNLARTSVTVNGTEVKSRCKRRLVVPSIIQLNDKTKLNLDVLMQKVKFSENRSTEDEQQKEQESDS